MTVRLEQWTLYGTRLNGTVIGHPRLLDGYSVMTSPVVSVNGREITTRSGTVYVLGTPLCECSDCQLGKGIDPLGDSWKS